MPQFRKKPVVIEAIQFSRIEHDAQGPCPVFEADPPGWLTKAMELDDSAEGSVCWSDDGLHIATLEGEHLASPGDYIIRGVKGEIYPCKPDIFAATYDAVQPGAHPMSGQESGRETPEMVLRVAKAISGAPFPTAQSIKKARAAIQAMREPTQPMVDRAWAMIRSNLRHEEVYRHLIDAALSGSRTGAEQAARED